MKVAVKNIKINPFRNLDNYIIQRERVEALKNSIQETGWWDNILARPTENGSVQIAYGHHRLVALQELGVKEVDIPVKELDDATMLKIMANENMEDWKASPAVVNETVAEVKKFLDEKVRNSNSFSQFKARVSKSIHALFGNAGTYEQVKKNGVGWKAILAFLGKNWKAWMVQEALSVLKEDAKAKAAPPEKRKTLATVDKKAYESFETVARARKFKQAVKRHKIPLKDQPGLAKALAKSGEDIDSAVAVTAEVLAPKKQLKEPKTLPNIDKFVEETVKQMNAVNKALLRIAPHVGSIESGATEASLMLAVRDLDKTIQVILEGATV
jgi:hypothetical protein